MAVSVLGLVALASDKRLLLLVHWISLIVFTNILLLYAIIGLVGVGPTKTKFKASLNSSLVSLFLDY